MKSILPGGGVVAMRGEAVFGTHTHTLPNQVVKTLQTKPKGLRF